MTNIRIASLNSNGLNGQIKRAMCLDYLWRHIIDVAFTQESHLRDDDVKQFASRFHYTAASSSFNSRSHGSLVVLKRSLSLSIMETFGSSDGCISYVKAVIAGRKTCLISIYTPNQFELKYVTELLSDLQNNFAVIIGADMNQHLHNLATAAFQGLVSDFSLIDLFRKHSFSPYFKTVHSFRK